MMACCHMHAVLAPAMQLMPRLDIMAYDWACARINSAKVLFPGVVCFLIAAITGLFVHASNVDDIQKKLGKSRGHWLTKCAALSVHAC